MVPLSAVLAAVAAQTQHPWPEAGTECAVRQLAFSFGAALPLPETRGDQVWIRDETQWLAEAFRLPAEDSGSVLEPNVWSNEPVAPVLSAGVPPAGFNWTHCATCSTPGAWQASLSGNGAPHSGSFNSLAVDGRREVRERYPDQGTNGPMLARLSPKHGHISALKTDDLAFLPCHHGGPCTGRNVTPAHLKPRLHNTPSCLQTSGPHDMAATITLPHADGGAVHHIFQFCIPCDYTDPERTCYFGQGNDNPNSANGSWAENNVGAAWQHATSRDLVTWTNRGNQIGTYSGFLLKAEDGKIYAGQRCDNVWCDANGTKVAPQCGDPRQTGCPGVVINGTGPISGLVHSVDMVPLFITSATDETLTKWEGHHYPFNPSEYRGMAFDPQAWRDVDGKVYIAVATDGCNSTTRKMPCVDGSAIFLWRAPSLLSNPEQWEALGAMFTTNDDAMAKGGSRGEMVTPSYTGNLAGDPQGGSTRLLTNNVCHGTTYWLGNQANGSKFLDRKGGWTFARDGETGMIDWAAVVANSSAIASGKTGKEALSTGMQMVPGTCHAAYSMARTLGDPSGQTVATKGRKIMVAWIGNGTFASQSLPRDLSLSPADGSLRQTWIPELQKLRVGGSLIKGGLQLEVFARFAVGTGTGRFGVNVLCTASGSEVTEVGVDPEAGIVFIDGRKSGSCDAMSWLCPHHLPNQPSSPRAAGLYPAGPLLGSRKIVSVHCYIDGVYVSCIFNNQTAVTAMVAPTADATADVASFGSGATATIEAWELAMPKAAAHSDPSSLKNNDSMTTSSWSIELPMKTDDTRAARPIIQWVSPATGPNQTLWISGSNLGLADATLCRTLTQCIAYTEPSPDFDRWPTQMRLVVPGYWPHLARYSLSLALSVDELETTATNFTVNGPVIHWWLSSELDGQAHPGTGWVRLYGDNLALGSDTQPKARTEGCVDPRKPRTGTDTVLRLRLCCGPGCTWFELVAQSEDCNSAEFHVPASAVHAPSTSCTMRVGYQHLEGNLILRASSADTRRRIRVLPGNSTDLTKILADGKSNTVLDLSGVYRMSGSSLRVPAGVTLQGPAELIYGTATWLPGSTCLLGQLGFAAPAWRMIDVTVTVAANISCNTADGLDTPVNAVVCMGGSGSTILRAKIRSIRSSGSRFCHLFHASGASSLSITDSTFDLRMDANERALPRVLSMDNCSSVLVEGNTMFSDAEGWIISSSNRVAFTNNVCNSSISDGSHGNTLGTYHPPARLDNIIVNRNTIVNQGTTMDGPGQSWSPLALPNSSLGHYGPVRQGTNPTEFELVGATLGDPVLFEGMGLAVMAGTGVEQIRSVVSVRARRFVTVNKPLEVAVDHTSVVALTLYRYRVAVVGNSFSTRMKDIMFWAYGGCSECSVSYNDGVGNQPANTTEIGLALWPRSIHGLIEAVHRTVMTDNVVKQFGTVGLVGGLENYLPMLHNCSLPTGRSVVIRRNVVSDGSWMVVTPGPTRYINLIGAMLEGNQITGFNTAVGAVPIAVANSTSRLIVRQNFCNNSLC